MSKKISRGLTEQVFFGVPHTDILYTSQSMTAEEDAYFKGIFNLAKTFERFEPALVIKQLLTLTEEDKLNFMALLHFNAYGYEEFKPTFRKSLDLDSRRSKYLDILKSNSGVPPLFTSPVSIVDNLNKLGQLIMEEVIIYQDYKHEFKKLIPNSQAPLILILDALAPKSYLDENERQLFLVETLSRCSDVKTFDYLLEYFSNREKLKRFIGIEISTNEFHRLLLNILTTFNMKGSICYGSTFDIFKHANEAFKNYLYQITGDIERVYENATKLPTNEVNISLFTPIEKFNENEKKYLPLLLLNMESNVYSGNASIIGSGAYKAKQIYDLVISNKHSIYLNEDNKLAIDIEEVNCSIVSKINYNQMKKYSPALFRTTKLDELMYYLLYDLETSIYLPSEEKPYSMHYKYAKKYILEEGLKFNEEMLENYLSLAVFIVVYLVVGCDWDDPYQSRYKGPKPSLLRLNEDETYIYFARDLIEEYGSDYQVNSFSEVKFRTFSEIFKFIYFNRAKTQYSLRKKIVFSY